MPPDTQTAPVSHETAVTYYAGRSSLSAVPAVLRWQDSAISLAVTPKNATGVEGQIALSCTPAQIIRVTNLGYGGLKFRTKKGAYTVTTLPQKEMLRVGAWASLFGLLGSPALTSGLFTKQAVMAPALQESRWWRDQLKAAGVPVRTTKLVPILLIGCAAAIIGILLLPRP